ncbi:MAG: efflux RND transporter periplasmic adaptor subunit [Thermoguttaceae bacterium]
MPRTLGEYQLLEELGRGGMGRVYKALQTKLDRVVAVKVLPRGRVGDRQAITRFEREMKAVGRLAHPNIVQAHDAREIDDTPVLIMEFVDGLDLAEMVRRLGPLPTAEACELVRRTALALQCAYEHGLVHRDIKPSNIMLARSGEVKLLDLGLARFYAEGGGSAEPASAGEEMTGTGQAMGTADYMAPEQASDSRTVDIRADLYSLGCTLYKLLSGRAPFSGPEYRSTLDKLNAHVHQPVPPICSFAPEATEDLTAILDRMLAKDPSERFAAPAEVAMAIEPFCKAADLADLISRAMAIDEGSRSQHERPSASPLSFRDRVSVRVCAPTLRRPILGRILIGLGFLGAMAAAFVAGILITIKRDGKETNIDVPDGTNARFTADGQLEVTLPGKTKSAEEAQQMQPFSTGPVAGLKAVEGTWSVVHVEKGDATDETWPEEFLTLGKRFRFDDATLEIWDVGRASLAEYRFNVDSNVLPTSMDLNWFDRRSPTAYPYALGVYEIDGNQLKLCLANCERSLGTEQRPKTLAVEPHGGYVLLTLQRYRPSADEEGIQGNWSMVTRIEDGETMPEEKDQARPTFQFSEYRVSGINPFIKHERNPFTQWGFMLDPGKQPKTITMHGESLVGTRKSHEFLGIYKFENDRLTIAYRQDGPRPMKFESTPGSGVTLLMLERPKAPAGTVRAQAPDALLPGGVQPSASSAVRRGMKLLYFYAAWANVCRPMTPVVEKLAGEGYAVQRVNIDQEPKLAQRFQVTSLPCFVVLERGMEIDRVVGGTTVARLKAALQRPLADASPAVPTATSSVNPAAVVKPLQGRWKVVRVEKGENTDASLAAMVGFDGNHKSPANLGYGYLSFGNGTLRIFDYTTMDNVLYHYEIDPTPATKTIDLILGPRRPEQRREPTMLGIYEVDGDRLRLCLARRLPEVKIEQRPRQFALERGSGDILVLLDRDYPSDDEKAIQGRWNVIGQTEDGKPASPQHLESMTGEYNRNTFAIRCQDGPGTVLTGPCVLDTAKKPKTITIRATVNWERGGGWTMESQELFGIYKFENDRLHIAYRPNGPPPEKFESTPGSGVTLLVLERPKAPAETGSAPAPGTPHPETSAALVLPKAVVTPPEVTVVHPIVRQITDLADFPGYLQAAQTAEARSRVTGHLAKIFFQPGAMVKQGEVLFELGPEPFQAELDKREADVRLAQLRLNRTTAEMKDAKTPSTDEHRRLEAQQAEAEAAFTAAQEGLKVARLNLASTRLTAPIGGKIGRPMVPVGSLVTDSMPLATIDSVDPMCVAFDVDQNTILKLRRDPTHHDGEVGLPVLVALSDEKDFRYKGKVESADNRLDVAGRARWRALLPNPDGLLMPGMFVHVRLVTSDPYTALLVPQTAIFFYLDQEQPVQQHSAAFIVTDQNALHRREIQIGDRDDDGMRVVKKGLTSDDWVIEKGWPTRTGDTWGDGMTVKPLKPAAVPPASPKGTPPASPKPDEPASGKGQAPSGATKSPTTTNGKPDKQSLQQTPGQALSHLSSGDVRSSAAS